jgi:DNA-binding NtrC family response regulator
MLIVDDEMVVRDSLMAWFREAGYPVDAAACGKEALERMARQEYDVFLLDIRMVGMDGLELQSRIKKAREDAAVIIMTAYASVETAVQALKQGAFDYIVKPFDPDELEHVVRNAVEKQSLQRENAALKANLRNSEVFPDIVGECSAIRKVLELVKTVAPTNAAVLIRGESGTGKELVAKAIHAGSQRRYMPFVTVNCGALPESLLESELFGHERGAFTGAQYRRRGRFEMADGGTVFLDEIWDVSAKTQSDLLRVLEEKQICRVGGGQMIPVDFRVVAASDKDLQSLVSAGQFREDLFYRLNVVPIQLPSLRERAEDIPLLVRSFIEKASRQMGKVVSGVTPEDMAHLRQRAWPGNIRELQNAVERAVVLAHGEELTVDDLALDENTAPPPPAGEADASLSEIEKVHIARVLDHNDWNISLSARILGIDRATLYNKIKRYGLVQSRV